MFRDTLLGTRKGRMEAKKEKKQHLNTSREVWNEYIEPPMGGNSLRNYVTLSAEIINCTENEVILRFQERRMF